MNVGWRNQKGLRVAFQGTGSPLDEFLGENVTVTGFFPFHHLDEWRFFPAYDLPNAFACNGRFEIYKGFSFSQPEIRVSALQKGGGRERRTIEKAGREVDANVHVPATFSPLLRYPWDVLRL